MESYVAKALVRFKVWPVIWGLNPFFARQSVEPFQGCATGVGHHNDLVEA